MTARASRAESAAIGLRAHSGWAALVAVVGPVASPAVVARRRIDLAGPDIPKQPYHAAENLSLAKAEELLARCVAGSRRLASEGVSETLSALRRDGRSVSACALLLASGRKLPELSAVLASHALIHTADGEHFRDALRHAAARAKLPLAAIPEKEIWQRAAARLGVPEDELARRVAALGRPLGPPWTRDQKLAALAAWTALAESRRP